MLSFRLTPGIFFFCQLKKWFFYQDKLGFLKYMVSSKNISIKAIKIDNVKDWSKLSLVCDI